MADSAELHATTDQIYKGLLSSFQPSMRQLMTAGKSYLKALSVLSQQAKVYMDTLATIASHAKESKGATVEIGLSISQMVESQRQIQKLLDDNARSFLLDFILRVESKYEPDFKDLTQIQRNYGLDHKNLVSPYEKAMAGVRKQRKKTRNKPTGFDVKEQRCLHEASQRKEKLDSFRQNSLKQALLRERHVYCFLLDQLCLQTRNAAVYHLKSHEQLARRQAGWSELCRDPDTLPEASQALLALPRQVDHHYSPFDELAGGEGPEGLDDSYELGGSLGSADTAPFENSSQGFSGSAASDYGSSSGGYPAPLEPAAPPKPPYSRGQRLSAQHAHAGAGESQLSFAEADTILVMGDQEEKGWLYGQNVRTGRKGWFPASFMRPQASASRPASPVATRHARSGEGVGGGLEQSGGKFRSMTDLRGDDQQGRAKPRPLTIYDTYSRSRSGPLAAAVSMPRPPSAAEIAYHATTLPRRPYMIANGAPPPPLRRHPGPPDSEDDIGDERNNPFAGAKLRKAPVVNDRSAPRV